MIAAALFLLALTVVGQLAIMGMRSKVTGEDKNMAFRMGTNALDQLNRDLTHCEEIYFPTNLSTAHPGTADATLVLRTESSRSGAPRPAVVGYSLDSKTRSLNRVFYEPDFNPANPGSQKVAVGDSVKTEAKWVDDFTVSALSPADHYGVRMVDSELRISTAYEGQTGPSLQLGTRTRLRQP